jgi:uncharacterized DUF497 family protein
MIAWDEKKRKQVLKDHGVDFSRLEDVFEDPNGLYLEDDEHSSDDESRLKVIAFSAAYGLVFVTFTFIDDRTIRLITARRAEKWMVRVYEKARKRL